MRTELDCFHSKTSTLRKIENENPRCALALLVVLIVDLADSFNIGKNMTANQVAEAAQLVLDEYKDYKVDDFALCFMQAKKGRYGKVFDRLDVQVIFEFLNRFDADKTEQVEYYHQSAHRKNLEDSKNLLPAAAPADDETALGYIRQIKEQVVAIQEKAKKPAPVAPRTLNEQQKMFNGFIAQFDKHHRRKPHTDQYGRVIGRFIRKYGRLLDVQDYLSHKVEQMEMVERRRKNPNWFKNRKVA